MGIWQFSALLDGLPPESLTMTAIRVDRAKRDEEEAESSDRPAQSTAPPEPEFDAADFPWSKSEMLLGDVIDELRVIRHIQLVKGSAKGSSVPLPKMLPRPGVSARGSRRPHATKLPPWQREVLLEQRRKNEESWDKLRAEKKRAAQKAQGQGD